jgi:hypothetical protein
MSLKYEPISVEIRWMLGGMEGMPTRGTTKVSPPPDLGGNVHKSVPHEALRLIASGKLTFDERSVVSVWHPQTASPVNYSGSPVRADGLNEAARIVGTNSFVWASCRPSPRCRANSAHTRQPSGLSLRVNVHKPFDVVRAGRMDWTREPESSGPTRLPGLPPDRRAPAWI